VCVPVSHAYFEFVFVLYFNARVRHKRARVCAVRACSGGWVFVILVLLLSVFYFGGGACYKKARRSPRAARGHCSAYTHSRAGTRECARTHIHTATPNLHPSASLHLFSHFQGCLREGRVHTTPALTRTRVQCALGASGVEALPHIDFWRHLIELVLVRGLV
jgi:hypothetical protein